MGKGVYRMSYAKLRRSAECVLCGLDANAPLAGECGCVDIATAVTSVICRYSNRFLSSISTLSSSNKSSIFAVIIFIVGT